MFADGKSMVSTQHIQSPDSHPLSTSFGLEGGGTMRLSPSPEGEAGEWRDLSGPPPEWGRAGAKPGL